MNTKRWDLGCNSSSGNWGGALYSSCYARSTWTTILSCPLLYLQQLPYWIPLNNSYFVYSGLLFMYVYRRLSWSPSPLLTGGKGGLLAPPLFGRPSAQKVIMLKNSEKTSYPVEIILAFCLAANMRNPAIFCHLQSQNNWKPCFEFTSVYRSGWDLKS